MTSREHPAGDDVHVTHLFSTAYDGDLEQADLRAFEAHMAGCGRCASRFGHYRDRVDAVRGLPTVPMPVPVNLPAGATRNSLTALLVGLRGRRASGWAAGMAGAAAALLIGVAVLRSGMGTGVPGEPRTAVAPPPGGAISGATKGSVAALCGPAAPQAAGATPGAPAATLVPQARLSDVAAQFPHRVISGSPGRPGQVLTVATAGEHVVAGTTVSVFAELTAAPAVSPHPGGSDSGSAPLAQVVAACVTLTGGFTSASAEAAAPEAPGPADRGGFTVRGPLAAGGQPLATGSIAPESLGSGVPVQHVTIPAGLPKGSVLRLTAVAPGGPAPSDPPITAELTLTVG
ncbi:MAG: anti-sigma factor [Candidatus Dormibacteria bacterium]